MGLELEVAGGPAPVNMVAVESFLMASGWQRNAAGKLAPMGSVGRAVAVSAAVRGRLLDAIRRE